MKIRLWIPNIITFCNLVCGVVAILMATRGYVHWAALFIIIAAIFDLFDGLAARILNAKSQIGAQLDSLSDLVSFGVAPGILMFTIVSALLFEGTSITDHVNNAFLYGDGLYPDNYWNVTWIFTHYDNVSHVAYSIWDFPINYMEINVYQFMAVIVFICAGAYRLAKFNTLPPSSDFKGLAIPSAAIVIAGMSLAMDYEMYHHGLRFAVLWSPNTYYILMVILSLLMVSNVRMFSFKMKSLKWTDSKIQYLFLILCIPAVIVSIFLENFWLSIPLIVLLYLIISLIDNILNKNEV